MDAVFHADLVTGQERRRDMAGIGEVAELFVAGEGLRHDGGRFRVTGVGGGCLQVVLGLVGEIGNTPVQESDARGELGQARNRLRT